MEVFRIVHRKWSSRLMASGYAARWNSNGMFVIYSAQNASLACLENLVHRNGVGLDSDFMLLTIAIEDSVSRLEINLENLPIGWSNATEKGHLLCRKIGDDWLKNQQSGLLTVPSAIIANEKNILINPNHKDFEKISITIVQPFAFDKRLR